MTFEEAEHGGLRRVPIPASYVEIEWQGRYRTVVERYRDVVRRYAARPAVIEGPLEWTYAEFDAMVNRIAHAILARLPPAQGAQGSIEDSAEPVAVLLGQGACSIAALMAVMSAGKVYVPLDPSDSPRRTEQVLRDVSPRLLLTDEANLPKAKTLPQGVSSIIAVDSMGAGFSPNDPELDVASDSLAYISYTSGSTGQPKGVMHDHAALLEDIRRRSVAHRICPDDHVSLLGSATTQALKNALMGLLNGAALFPVDVRNKGFARPAAWLREHRITVLTLVVPLFRELLEDLGPDENLPWIRVLRLTSDHVTPLDIIGFQKHFSVEAVLLNMLAASETGPICAYVFDRSVRLGDAQVPVGYALDDDRVALLDEAGKSCAPGQHGRIAVRSKTLFRGYWRRPELTRAAWVADPEQSGHRLFLSSDLARMRSDGTLVLLGRSDFQLKIRGLLVEVPEVEATLMAHASVRDAVVHPEENEDAHRRLVAYVVEEPGQCLGVAELRAFLAERIAAHMIPSVFVKVADIPRLPNGKSNRRALPRPPRARSDLMVPPRAPASVAEKLLTETWSEILGIGTVGVDDDFLELGGDSLLAMRVLARCRDAFGVDLPATAVLESRTIAALARRIRDAGTDRHSAERPGPTACIAGQREYVLSPGQTSLWFAHQLDPFSAAYNMPKVFRLDGTLDAGILRDALARIVARHEILRTVYAVTEDGPVAHVRPASDIGLPIADLSGLAPEARQSRLDEVLRESTEQPFDLAKDAMLRCMLVRLQPDHHVLLCVTHHIASDRISGTLLFEEIGRIYESAREGIVSALPVLPVQYADFARWQTSNERQDVFRSNLSEWEQLLADAPPRSCFPTDFARPGRQSFRGATVRFVLPAAQAEAVRRFARGAGATPFMVLMAVFMALLYRQTGQSDLVVGCSVSGRSRTEFERLIGYFVNVLALRSTLTEKMSFRKLVDSVRATSLRAVRLSDVPFGQVVARLLGKRDPTYHPLFQVLFDVYQRGLEELKCADLSLSVANFDRGASPFDMGWTLAIDAIGIHGRIEYNSDLFRRDTVERLVDQFGNLLESALDDPESTIDQLALINEVAGYRIFSGWNATLAPRAEVLRPLQLIDRRSCHLIERERPDPYAAPSSRTEQWLAAIWCELLRIERVAIDDDFFELGGHSLLALRVVSRIRLQCGARLELRTIFEQPTIRGIAMEILRRTETQDIGEI